MTGSDKLAKRAARRTKRIELLDRQSFLTHRSTKIREFTGKPSTIFESTGTRFDSAQAHRWH
jgi:hypothetical protein